jgi:septal ring factor EnvC (AmiA/AmiB activator)
MTLALGIRRSLVIVGVAAALVLGALSIRLAANWTAAAAPLAVPPASLTSIKAALAAEQQRSAALQTQLKNLESASGDLTAALAAAREKIAADAGTAATLRTDLATAQAKLNALQAALAKAAATRSVTTTSGSGSASALAGEADDD